MCGIFGLIRKENAKVNITTCKSLLDYLFKLSESRGKEAAGLAFNQMNNVKVLKEPCCASTFIRSKQYKDFYSNLDNKTAHSAFSIIGHSRLVTNGFQDNNDNNQPVSNNTSAIVHNGIIVNDLELWSRFPSLTRHYQVDTEVILALINKFKQDGKTFSEASKETFKLLKGSASIALIESNKVILATNTGSLYYCYDTSNGIFVFASERYILKSLLNKKVSKGILNESQITQIKAGYGCLIDIVNLELTPFSLCSDISLKKEAEKRTNFNFNKHEKAIQYENIKNLVRCKKCILPSTFPFIEFDDEGVCNYCNSHQTQTVLGKDALEKLVEKYRSKNGEPDCIVAFSGGRDSSYGLHYIKKELNLNPIAFTYDWGMVTDLARRNCARICGQLGIEHIIVSADITKKRNYVKKNVEAWLKKPDLGMIPLFMAGDKQFYYYANKIKKQTGINLSFFCAGNALEKTDFKTGFCGINKGSSNGILTNLPLANKFKLASYYGKEYLRNPAYINSSIFDTLWAFASSYLIPHDYVYLYHYINWDENEIMSTILNDYNWETANDTKLVWRIGDGTASFYNYIYYTAAGFTENDTFRSNQIREGLITREEALRFIAEENIPRFDTIREYCDLINIDFDEAVKVINKIPKLYTT